MNDAAKIPYKGIKFIFEKKVTADETIVIDNKNNVFSNLIMILVKKFDKLSNKLETNIRGKM